MRYALCLLVIFLCGCAKQASLADAQIAFQSIQPAYTIEKIVLEEREVAAVTFIVTARPPGSKAQEFRLTYWPDEEHWQAVPR